MSYSCLSITREEFLVIYDGLNVINYIDLFYTEPQNDLDIAYNYLPSKLWRLNNLYTIINKEGKRIKFKMNKSQHKAYAASLRHPRVIILKSRQQGISTFWLIDYFDDAITIPDLSIGLMAQGKDESSSLLERTKLLWDTLDPNVKSFLGISNTADSALEFSFSNNSTIFIRTSFRSTTLQRLHVSEMGKIANKYPEKANETKSGTLQALAQGNTGVIESTAEGDNVFKDMWDNAVTHMHTRSLKDFYPLFLSWIDDPDCIITTPQPFTDRQLKYFAEIERELRIKLSDEQKYFWVVQARELGDRVYQEYPATPTEAFMSTRDGTYYARAFYEWVIGQKRIIPFEELYDPNLAVQIAVDLGMDDTNVLGVIQTYKDEFRLLDEFYDNGQDIKYYCDWIKDQPWIRNLTHVVLPHDAEVRELTSGKKRIEVFEEELAFDKQGNPLTVEFTILPKTESVQEDIEKVRQVIPKLWLSDRMDYIKRCLVNYKKEWNERTQKFRNKPKDDDVNHGADMFRYGVLGCERGTIFKRKTLMNKQSLSRNKGETEI